MKNILELLSFLFFFDRLSPLAVLIAMRVYEQGAAALKWTRNCSVVEALNTAFIFALKVLVCKSIHLAIHYLNFLRMKCALKV